MEIAERNTRYIYTKKEIFITGGFRILFGYHSKTEKAYQLKKQ